MAHVRSAITSGALFVDGGTNTTYTYTYPAVPANGNLVVLCVATTSVRTVSSAAGAGMTFSINGANTNVPTADYNISQWKAIANGTDTTVTVTISGADSGTAYFAFLEFDSVSSDQSGSTANGASAAPAAGTTHNSGSVTPPTANNVIVTSMIRTNGTWTEDATSFVQVTGGTQNWVAAYIVQAAATAQEYNVTAADSGEYSGMRIGAFAGAAAGGSTIAAKVHHLRQQGIA